MAKNREFKIITTENGDLNRVQNNVAAFVEPLQNSEIWQGRILKDVSLASASTTLVEHKLNREIQGWIIVSKNAQSDIWKDTSSSIIGKRYLGLKCSVDVIVDIWIF